MNFADLSPEDQALVNTKFPANLEKVSAEKVVKMTEFYDVGFTKMAADSADAFDKVAEEEGEVDWSSRLNPGQIKEAEESGAFIARGFVDGLFKEGQERHDWELEYLYPAIQEKLAEAGFMGKSKDWVKGQWAKVKGGVSSGAAKVKEKAKAGGTYAKGKATAAGATMRNNKLRTAAGAAAGVGAIYGAHRLHKHMKEKKD